MLNLPGLAFTTAISSAMFLAGKSALTCRMNGVNDISDTYSKLLCGSYCTFPVSVGLMIRDVPPP